MVRKFERIRERLEELGRTKKWFAQQCGIQPSTVNRIINGHTNPGRPLIKLMALTLNVPESDIFDVEKPTRSPSRSIEQKATERAASAS